MVGTDRREREKRKRLVMLSVILLILSNTVFAEDFNGQIILEKTSFLVNEEFRLSLLVPEWLPAKLEITEPPMPPGLVLVSGPSSRPGRNGSIVEYIFRPATEGRFIIDSFIVRTPEKTMKTTPVFITAAPTFQIQGSFDKVPPVINWDIPDGKYYPGEIIPLRFAIRSIETSDLIIESSVSQKPEGFVKKTSRFAARSEETVIPRKVMTGEIYDVLFHDHIFVAFEPGNVILPDVEIFLSKGEAGYRAKLKGISITVDQAPGAGSSTGALGNFAYKYELSGNAMSASQGILLKQRISGRGNFYGIDMPVPYVDSPGLVEISLLKDSYETVPDGRLFAGYRELTYSLRKDRSDNEGVKTQQDSSEAVILTVPEFTWYEENYSDLPPGMGLKRAPGGIEKISYSAKSLAAASRPLPAQFKMVKTGKGIYRFLAALLFIAIIPVVFFIIRKNRKQVIAASFVAFVILVSLLTVREILLDVPVYGIVLNESPEVALYTVPEAESGVKMLVDIGEKVRILDEKGEYYLVEMPDATTGWIIRKNIILEK